MKSVAIMQPYFLPYLGYFQLIAAADVLVLLDDVHYIQRGWINRNRILLHGQPHLFTLPLLGASQNRLICDIERLPRSGWQEKFRRTLHQAYHHAPNYAAVAALLDRILACPALQLDVYLLHSLRELMAYLGLMTPLVATSRVYDNAALRGQERILDICQREDATDYLNPIGGAQLYEHAAFRQRGLSLRFLKSRMVSYDQGGLPHIPDLSIIDVLMYNSPPVVRDLLMEKDLV